MESNKINLSEILQAYEKIIIPEIQRDYVMGSGGQKLVSLFSAMRNSLEKGKEFGFSCIVAYKDGDNNSLYVYDGQQRLATLVFLCSYLNKDEANMKLFNKFEFIGREKANEWIANPEKIDDSEVEDFTTYSLLELKKSFEEKWLENNKKDGILEFLQKKVYFNMVLVDKISDAEQFFLDINDGLDLKSYEIYKAALYHHASTILNNSFKAFALKMENEWLNFFSKYAQKQKMKLKNEIPEVCEEEVLVYFLKYCFRMIWIEEGNNGEFVEDDVTWLKKEHFEKVENITDKIVEKFTNETSITDKIVEKKETSTELQRHIINYSINGLIFKRGPHWNITYKNYSEMLNKFFDNIWDIEETKKDIIVWCYISRLPNGSDKDIDDHLRNIRKILNHNRFECDRANISFWKKEGVHKRTIYYARYCVRGIPKYYLDFFNDEEYENYYGKGEDSGYVGFFNEIIKNSKNNDLANWKTENSLLRSIINNEILKKNSNDNSEIIEKIENISFINGIIDNFLEYDYQNNTCTLKYNNIDELMKLNSKNNDQYKDILKFVCDNKLKIDNFMFNEVTVYWTVYTGKDYSKKGNLIPHTWCDFFTIKTDKIGNTLFESSEEADLRNEDLDLIPDGWFDNSKNIVQPEENITGRGFAGWGRITTVFKCSSS